MLPYLVWEAHLPYGPLNAAPSTLQECPGVENEAILILRLRLGLVITLGEPLKIATRRKQSS